MVKGGILQPRPCSLAQLGISRGTAAPVVTRWRATKQDQSRCDVRGTIVGQAPGGLPGAAILRQIRFR